MRAIRLVITLMWLEFFYLFARWDKLFSTIVGSKAEVSSFYSWVQWSLVSFWAILFGILRLFLSEEFGKGSYMSEFEDWADKRMINKLIVLLAFFLVTVWVLYLQYNFLNQWI